MILRCTQKFLKELRLKKADIAVYPQAEDPLDEWYAHVFTLYPRRKCAVFAHVRTMFCFFAFDVKRDALDNIGVFFCQRLGSALFDEHYPEEVIRLFNNRMREIRITATADRVTVGFINRMIWEIQYSAKEIPEAEKLRDEYSLGMHYRRGIFMALPHIPVKVMRDMLAQWVC